MHVCTTMTVMMVASDSDEAYGDIAVMMSRMTVMVMVSMLALVMAM